MKSNHNYLCPHRHSSWKNPSEISWGSYRALTQRGQEYSQVGVLSQCQSSLIFQRWVLPVKLLTVFTVLLLVPSKSSWIRWQDWDTLHVLCNMIGTEPMVKKHQLWSLPLLFLYYNYITIISFLLSTHENVLFSGLVSYLMRQVI